VTLFLLLGIPAYAYADPSGGALFQILMPMLAALWATWMIFANRVRRMVTGLVRKLRGSEPEKPAA
jgi:Na+/proline symporter